jgi:TolA-binding protein
VSASHCPEDLLIRERRGTLGPGEQRALAEHAATCELCGLSRALGRDLVRDPLPALAGEAVGGETDRATELDVDGQEQTRLALIVARTMLMRGKVMRAGSAAPAELAPVPLPARRALPSRTRSRRRRARSPRRFAVAAALVLLAGSASAALWRWSAWSVEQARIKERAAEAVAHSGRAHRHAGSAGVAVPPEEVPAPTEQPPAIEEPLVPVAQSEQPVAPSPPVPVHVAPSPVTPPPAPQRRVAAASSKHSVPDLDARQLFVAAGQARRARNFAEAEGLYRDLQAHFPGSPEATLSFLSLGDLLLSQGAIAQALAQFDAYLASGDAMMAEEALVGRARALARLGRTEEERAAWRALLSRFPQSDYRWRAQQRLDHAGDAP